MIEFRTDKVANGYLPAYERLSRELYATTDGPARILEIGAGDGAGMEMLVEVFHTPDVFGVDVEPTRVSIPRVLVADQTDPGLPGKLANLAVQAGIPVRPWDVIVDDASHLPAETRQTLHNMWETVAPGGAYVVEDWNHVRPAEVLDALHGLIFGQMTSFRYATGAWESSFGLPGIRSVTVQHGLIILRKVAVWDALAR